MNSKAMTHSKPNHPAIRMDDYEEYILILYCSSADKLKHKFEFEVGSIVTEIGKSSQALGCTFPPVYG